MATKPIKIKDLTGGLDTSEPSIIDDNELALATNMYYNKDKILTTRRGSKTFGDSITGPQTSLYFTKLSDGTRILLMAAGTVMYKYNEGTSAWDSIKTGLTDGLKFSFVTYKDLVYWTNGTDNVMSYDNTTVSEHSGVQKGKYLIVANDTAYMAGVNATGDRSVVFYTGANPTDLKSSFANNEPIDEDNGQNITGLTSLGALVFVGKQDSIYTLNTIPTTVVVEKVDYSGGVLGHRSWANVENDLMHLSREGVYSLAQRRGVTGSYRATSLTDDIQAIIDNVENKDIAAAIYVPETRNYYLAVDTGGVGKNNDIFVWSVLTRSWTRYDGLNANDFVIYEDASGDRHLLAADPFGGQTREIEVNFDDSDVSIVCEAKSKTFDFEAPETSKVFQMVDVAGFISKQATISVTISIDGTDVVQTLSGSSYVDSAGSQVYTLGTSPLGFRPIGGGGGAPSSSLDLFPFIARIPLYKTGRNISVKLSSSTASSAWQWTKVNVFAEALPVNVFRNDFII